MVIKGYRVGPLLRKTFSEVGDDGVTTLAASAAYNFFFSLFPLLLFLTPLLTIAVNKQRTINWLLSQLASVLPAAQLNAFQPILKTVVFSSNAPSVMSVGALLAAWSGSNIFGTLIAALNTAYDVRETRSWIKQQLVRLVALAVGAIVMIAATTVLLDGDRIARWLGGLFDLGSVAMLTWQIVQVPLAAVSLMALAFLVYTLLPNVTQHKAHALVASAVTTVLWILATLLFRLYIAHFPPNPAYGLIGGVIILLTWMYYTMFVVLVGGELASELHHGTGAVAPDKGAIYVGRIVNRTGRGTAPIEGGG